MGWTDRGRAGARLIGVALVGYLFILLLITAAAQQQAVARLGSTEYSVARRAVLDAEKLQREQESLRSHVESLEGLREELERDLADEDLAYDSAWSTIAALAARTPLNDDCRARGALRDIVAADDAPDGRLAVWHELLGCARAGALGPAQVSQLQKLVGTDADFAAAHDRRLKLINSEQAAERRLRLTNETIVRNAMALAANRHPAIFADLTAMRDNPLLANGIFVSLPPVVLQIVLAFFSGTFGAMLLILILIVYPDNGLNFTSSDNFGARVLLGGLISIGVYVVLSGGTAVLGTVPQEGRANFMTFCAVGILSGMFSDRVAGWLSRRADIFLAQDPGEAPR